MDLRNFGRPLIRKNESADFPFSSSATGVMCKVENARIVLTAKHVAFPGETTSHDHARRLTTILDIDSPAGELIHFSNIHHGDITQDGVPQVCSDLIALQAQQDQAGRIRHAIPLYDNNSWIGVRLPRIGRSIVAYGYPNWPDRLVIDFEQRRLDANPIQVFARMTGWENGNTIGVARVTSIHDREGHPIAPPMDGLSGSPVYYEADGQASFIGMILMAGPGVIRFVQSFVIRDMVRHLELEPEVL